MILFNYSTASMSVTVRHADGWLFVVHYVSPVHKFLLNLNSYSYMYS